MCRHMAFPLRPGRIDIKVPVVLGVDGERVSGETRNVGLGGAFVATGAPLFVGQRLALRLTLPDLDEPLLVEGEVRWARARVEVGHRDGVPGFGVKFVRLPLYVAAALDNLVRSYARDR